MKARVRNNSIDVFRFFCALLIVAIHVHPLLQFGENANAVFTDYVTRIGVPFFFVTSGYFYSKGLAAGKRRLKPFLLKLFGLYAFWSAVYFVKTAIVNFSCGKPFSFTLKAVAENFIYKGTSEHLWFVPSLMIAVCVLSLFHKINAERLLGIIGTVLFIIACLGFSYRYALGDKIPVLSALYASKEFTVVHRMCIFGISFVSLGNILFRHEKGIMGRDGSVYAVSAVFLYIAFAAEKLAVAQYRLGSNTLYSLALYPLVAAIFAVLMLHPAPRLSMQAKYLRNAASFMYYSHPLFMFIFYQLLKPQLLVYLLVCAVTALISFALTKLNNKYLGFLNA